MINPASICSAETEAERVASRGEHAQSLFVGTEGLAGGMDDVLDESELAGTSGTQQGHRAGAFSGVVALPSSLVVVFEGNTAAQQHQPLGMASDRL